MKQETQAQIWARGIKKYSGVNVYENTRRRDVVTYRALHVYLLKKHLKWSLSDIARFYQKNGKTSYDHATVLHALNMFDNYCFYDKELIECLTAMSLMIPSDEVKRETLIAKLKYIDEEFYEPIDECMTDAVNMTALKNAEQIQKEKQRKKEEKLYAI